MTLRLVPWDIVHVPGLVEACNDPSISSRLPVPSPYTRSHGEDFVSSFAPSFFADGGCNFALEEDGRFVGCVSIRLVEPVERRGRVGYWVSPSARGRGVAPEAVRLVTEWARSEGFRVLELTIGVDNPSSQSVAFRSGFTLLEMLPGYEVSPDLIKDTYRFELVL